MKHAIRNMEYHMQNTWQWDAWGFTDGWPDRFTLSDIDGWFGYMAETNFNFIIVETKHWDGVSEKPTINLGSGQMIMLKRLAQNNPSFTVVLALGDTSTQTIHEYEVWHRNNVYNPKYDFKMFLTRWYETSKYRG